jgi:nicotinate-nucleotide adenylyltransferase
MVAAAVADEPTLVADDRELRRGRISYTVETLEELRAERGDEVPLVVLIGQDAFAGLPRWHRVEELLTLGHLAVATRPQEEEPAPTPELRLLLARFAVTDPARLAERPAGCIYRLPIPPLEISSTQLREALRAERSVRYLIPDPVLRIIETRGLYRHTP